MRDVLSCHLLEKKGGKFAVVVENRIFTMKAASRELAQEWVASINQAMQVLLIGSPVAIKRAGTHRKHGSGISNHPARKLYNRVWQSLDGAEITKLQTHFFGLNFDPASSMEDDVFQELLKDFQTDEKILNLLHGVLLNQGDVAATESLAKEMKQDIKCESPKRTSPPRRKHRRSVTHANINFSKRRRSSVELPGAPVTGMNQDDFKYALLHSAAHQAASSVDDTQDDTDGVATPKVGSGNTPDQTPPAQSRRERLVEWLASDKFFDACTNSKHFLASPKAVTVIWTALVARLHAEALAKTSQLKAARESARSSAKDMLGARYDQDYSQLHQKQIGSSVATPQGRGQGFSFMSPRARRSRNLGSYMSGDSECTSGYSSGSGTDGSEVSVDGSPAQTSKTFSNLLRRSSTLGVVREHGPQPNPACAEDFDTGAGLDASPAAPSGSDLEGPTLNEVLRVRRARAQKERRAALEKREGAPKPPAPPGEKAEGSPATKPIPPPPRQPKNDAAAGEDEGKNEGGSSSEDESDISSFLRTSTVFGGGSLIPARPLPEESEDSAPAGAPTLQRWYTISDKDKDEPAMALNNVELEQLPSLSDTDSEDTPLSSVRGISSGSSLASPPRHPRPSAIRQISQQFSVPFLAVEDADECKIDGAVPMGASPATSLQISVTIPRKPVGPRPRQPSADSTQSAGTGSRSPSVSRMVPCTPRSAPCPPKGPRPPAMPSPLSQEVSMQLDSSSAKSSAASTPTEASVSMTFATALGAPALANATIPVPPPPRLAADSAVTGFLIKQGRKIKSWRRRWFVMHGFSIRYYSQPPSSQRELENPKGEYVLLGCSVRNATPAEEAAHKAQGFAFSLTPSRSSKRVMWLCAETEENRKRWIQAATTHLQSLRTKVAGIASNITAAEIRNALRASGAASKRYKNSKSSISGSHLLDWLVSHGYAWDTEGAVALSNTLLAQDALFQVRDDNHRSMFLDSDSVFYSLDRVSSNSTPRGPATKRVSSSKSLNGGVFDDAKSASLSLKKGSVQAGDGGERESHWGVAFHWKDDCSQNCKQCFSASGVFADYVQAQCGGQHWDSALSSNLLQVMITPVRQLGMAPHAPPNLQVMNHRVVNPLWEALFRCLKGSNLDVRVESLEQITALLLGPKVSKDNCASLMAAGNWREWLLPLLSDIERGLPDWKHEKVFLYVMNLFAVLHYHALKARTDFTECFRTSYRLAMECATETCFMVPRTLISSMLTRLLKELPAKSKLMAGAAPRVEELIALTKTFIFFTPAAMPRDDDLAHLGQKADGSEGRRGSTKTARKHRDSSSWPVVTLKGWWYDLLPKEWVPSLHWREGLDGDQDLVHKVLELCQKLGLAKQQHVGSSNTNSNTTTPTAAAVSKAVDPNIIPEDYAELPEADQAALRRIQEEGRFFSDASSFLCMLETRTHNMTPSQISTLAESFVTAPSSSHRRRVFKQLCKQQK